MKTIAAGFVALCLSFGSAFAAGPTAIPLHETPRTLPQVEFEDASGAPLSLETWRGKVVLVNIWATWCAPCRAEMPMLDRLQARLGGDAFQVVPLSIDRAGAGVVRKFYEEIGIEHLQVAVDPSMSAARRLSVFGLPATLLIGPDGRELGRVVGPAEWDSPDFIRFFEDILKTNSAEGQ